jgi:fluoride exporter
MIHSLVTIASGGAIGAIARYATVMLSVRLFGVKFPIGTILVNSIGSFLAGFFMVLIMSRFAATDTLRLFLVVGFLGAFTTFSSFSWETWVLIENGETQNAFLNIFLNNFLALGLAFVGINVARWVDGGF